MFKGDVKKYMTLGTFEQPGLVALVIYRRAESVEHIRCTFLLFSFFLFFFLFFSLTFCVTTRSAVTHLNISLWIARASAHLDPASH